MLFKALRGLLPELALPLALLPALLFTAQPAAADTRTTSPLRIVALGDSLTAGYGVAPADAFPVQLQSALKSRGHNVVVENAGVSGDTTTQGLARLDWSVPPGTDAVIVELGANDMLRGLPPEVPRASLNKIVTRLKARGLVVLISGMRAAPNLGPAYQARFDVIFPEIATSHGVLLHPFFLEGVAGNPQLLQPDGLHPNAEGVSRIVEGILPDVEKLIAETQAARATP
ncbi:MAG: arylesterase [Xanthobacter sp.]